MHKTPVALALIWGKSFELTINKLSCAKVSFIISSNHPHVVIASDSICYWTDAIYRVSISVLLCKKCQKVVPVITREVAKLLIWERETWILSGLGPNQKQSRNESVPLKPPQINGRPFKTPPIEAHLYTVWPIYMKTLQLLGTKNNMFIPNL